MKIILTCRSCFYDRVSAKTTENGDWTKKIQMLQGLSGKRAFQVFHLKCDDIDEIYSGGMIKQS
jgi:hypothetical protein